MTGQTPQTKPGSVCRLGTSPQWGASSLREREPELAHLPMVPKHSQILEVYNNYICYLRVSMGQDSRCNLARFSSSELQSSQDSNGKEPLIRSHVDVGRIVFLGHFWTEASIFQKLFTEGLP